MCVHAQVRVCTCVCVSVCVCVCVFACVCEYHLSEDGAWGYIKSSCENRVCVCVCVCVCACVRACSHRFVSAELSSKQHTQIK